VTRNHPPVKGQDPTDHATMHPGLWLAFGDLCGADDWRNRASVHHERFVEPPKGGDGKGTFAVSNDYLSESGTLLCRETCRYTVVVREGGYLLVCQSEFTPGAGDLTFGDQEEMGLGVRLATPFTVKRGGALLDSEGRKG